MYWWIRRRCSLKWVHFLTIKKLCKQTTNFKYKRVFFIFSINEHQYLYIYANHKLQIELTRFRIFEIIYTKYKEKTNHFLLVFHLSVIESQTNKQKQSQCSNGNRSFYCYSVAKTRAKNTTMGDKKELF